MKSILAAFLLSLAVVPLRADDIADAKAAFKTLQEYEKTDDIRAPGLFATNCVVTVLVTDGTNKRSLVIPDGKFRGMLSNSIARKEGNSDVYEDVKYSQEGSSVRLDCTVLIADSSKRAPLSLLYERDSDGELRIKEMRITRPVDKLESPEDRPNKP